MNSTQIAVDLAKSIFEVAVSRRPGKVHESHRLSRRRFEKYFAVREPVEVLMEACGTAHHWGRTLEAMGHRVTLLPPGATSLVIGTATRRTVRMRRHSLEAARNDAIDRVPVERRPRSAGDRCIAPGAFGLPADAHGTHGTQYEGTCASSDIHDCYVERVEWSRLLGPPCVMMGCRPICAMCSMRCWTRSSR